MVRVSSCPDPATLDAHAAGLLPRSRIAPTDQHLAACRACLDRYLAVLNSPLTPAIPDCRVVAELGRGAAGIVYKAWWLQDAPRLVALKVLHLPGETEKDRFDREIAVLRHIDSPWIARCLRSGAVGEARYFIMDYVQGVHLDAYLKGREGAAAKIAVFQRVCQAVADAHQQGVIHRDLKPRNILIDERGQPHLLDFGICTVDAPDWSSWSQHTITQPGSIIGTLKYMSPEQAWGGAAGAVDHRADIWALGVMLHEIVTDGAHPYSLKPQADRPAFEALLNRLRRELPTLPRRLSIERSGDLVTLLQRCLTWERDDRLASARILADDLARWLDGRPIETRPFGLAYRLKRVAVGAALRSRAAAAAVFIAAALAAVWTSLYAFGAGWHVMGFETSASAAAMVNGRARPPTEAAGSTEAAGAADAAGPTDSAPPSAADSVLIVGVDDETAPAVAVYAAEQGLPGVTEDVRTWRSVHGSLMTRLVAARPAAVAWDFYFKTAQPADAAMAEGILALERADIPVTLAVVGYHADGSPDLSPALCAALGDRLRLGHITARDMVAKPGQFIMAVRRDDGAVVPHLALTTMAALCHPQAILDVEWPGQKRWLQLLYRVGPGAYLRQRDRLECTSVRAAQEAYNVISPGDNWAATAFRLNRPEFWAARTLPYQRLLSFSDAELRDRTAGRVLIFGELRTPSPEAPMDRHRVRYGAAWETSVPGSYLLADCLVGLLDGRFQRAACPPHPAMMAAMLACAVAGCLIPVRLAPRSSFRRRRGRHALWAALAALTLLGWTVIVLSRQEVAVWTAVLGVCLWVPMAGSMWVELTRNRYRILEDRRLAIEREPASGPLRTTTVRLTPATSLPATR